jgi:CTP synthase (UTP-ammonia lyase)
VACPALGRAPGGGALSGSPLRIHLREDSRARAIVGADHVDEEYNCNFELNPEYDEIFEETGLEFTGFGDRGESRIFEIPAHPFYVATLFQPQRKSRPGSPSPFAVGFVEAVAAAARVTRA